MKKPAEKWPCMYTSTGPLQPADVCVWAHAGWFVSGIMLCPFIRNGQGHPGLSGSGGPTLNPPATPKALPPYFREAAGNDCGMVRGRHSGGRRGAVFVDVKRNGQKKKWKFERGSGGGL